jgi:DNA polymerase eta
LIAINYPARSYGLSRHVKPSEAKEKCPEIICQHVATWKEGEDSWAYRENAAANIATQKACLDPYRLQSRRILACIKDSLPAPPLQRVEKASIDEVFLDLSAQVHSILLERYHELKGPPPYDDPSEQLPCPPTTALDWDTDALVDLDQPEAEDDSPDWDDVAMLIGSEIVRRVRRAIREQLKYTCSSGIARNKLLAKLGSGHKKPNQQTVIRNRAVQEFLRPFKFTKIRNLGGKLGDQVVAAFDTDNVDELLEVPFDQMKQKINDETATWLYHTIRGEDYSEVVSRTQIKSMLSAKSFRPSINNFEQGERWLRVFVADIFARLVEEGVLEHKRRPKTITLHHRQGGTTSSRQLPIPRGKTIDNGTLIELAKTLLRQVILEGRAFPCSNLSLSVGGFEDGPSGNRDIGGFLVRGEEAKSMNELRRNDSSSPVEHEQPLWKRRKTAGSSIQRFFKNELSRGNSEGSVDHLEELQGGKIEDAEHVDDDEGLFVSDDELGASARPLKQQSLDTYFCTRCFADIPVVDQAEHEDWHFAKVLQDADRTSSTVTPEPSTGSTKPKPGRPSKQTNRRGAGHSGEPSEKGQQKLTFGR